jgi:hypothetical protein
MFAWMDAFLKKMYALVASILHAELTKSWVGLLTLKFQTRTVEIHPPFKYSYSSQLANCLNPTTPL